MSDATARQDASEDPEQNIDPGTLHDAFRVMEQGTTNEYSKIDDPVSSQRLRQSLRYPTEPIWNPEEPAADVRLDLLGGNFLTPDFVSEFTGALHNLREMHGYAEPSEESGLSSPGHESVTRTKASHARTTSPTVRPSRLPSWSIFSFTFASVMVGMALASVLDHYGVTFSAWGMAFLITGGVGLWVTAILAANQDKRGQHSALKRSRSVQTPRYSREGDRQAP